jgi:glycosyltransferase involved in cell wall biosynthesis
MAATDEVLVVIPVHNRAPIVGRAIRSVLDQTHRDLRLVVVDDASTDDTVEAADCSIAGDPRAAIVRHRVNLGAAVARNTGAAHGAAPCIAFLDSDDFYDSTFLARALAVLRSEPDCDAVRVGVSVPVAELSADHLAVVFNSLITNQVMRRYAFDFVGGIPDAPEFRTYLAGEDIAFNQLFHWCFNTRRIEDRLYHHEPGPGSAIWHFIDRAKTAEGRVTFTSTPLDDAINRRILVLLGELRARIRRLAIGAAAG